MKLPEKKDDRHALYRNLMRECEVSRSERRSRYRRMRQWLLTGVEDDTRARYNKLEEYAKFSASYLYSETSTKFGLALPPNYGDVFTEELETAREDLYRYWHDTDCGSVFGLGVYWAHAYDSVVYKLVLTRNEPTLHLVADPSDVGVYEEQINSWDRQECVAHWYTMDTSAFRRYVAHRADGEDLAADAEASAVRGYEFNAELLPPAINRLVLASASPTMIGAINTTPDVMMASPKVAAPLVRMCELWVWDDDLEDYRVVTNYQNAERILSEIPNPLLAGEHPFFDLCLAPIPGYLWGRAPIESLLRLQYWRERKMDALDLRDDLTLNPPIVFEGLPTLDGERAKAFRRPGGNLTIATPNAKATPMIPPPLPDPFGFIEQIDQMFARMGGLPKAALGEAQQGTRTAEQTMIQAILGTGPTMDYAMRVEKALESIATSILRLRARVNDVPLVTKSSQKFLLSQIPQDVVARVWGHSSSPLYAQQTMEKATLAKQLGAIDNEDYLEYVDLPMTDTLKSKARKMAAGQSDTKREMLDIRKKEADAKMLSAEARAKQATMP